MAGVDRLEIAQALERLVVLVRRLSPPSEISLTSVSTLTSLAGSGPRRLTDLAAEERVTQPAMTQLVARLCGQGLVERRGDPADGRVVNVSITESGLEFIAARRAARAARLLEMLSELTPEEEAAIRAALPALSRLT